MIATVAAKEWKSLFASPLAWIVLAASTFYLADRLVIWLVRLAVSRHRAGRAEAGR